MSDWWFWITFIGRVAAVIVVTVWFFRVVKKIDRIEAWQRGYEARDEKENEE